MSDDADLDAGDEAVTGSLTFYWGELDLSAPGFAFPPQDTLTLALDDAQRLRFMTWDKFPSFHETFGAAPGDFPLQGTKHVEMVSGTVQNCDLSVEAAEFSATAFQLRTHIVCANAASDYVESIEGTSITDGWHVLYAQQGNLQGADIDAHAEGDIHDREPGWQAPAAGVPSSWSAPIALDSGTFPGGPYDRMTVTLDAEGKPLTLDFARFPRHLMYGMSMGDLPYSGEGRVTDDYLTATVEEFSASPSQFIVRHKTSGDGLSEYVEELSGSRGNDELMVHYFIQGKIRGSDIDAHAAGKLFPTAENAQIATDTRWDGTYACHGDTLADGGCTFALVAPWTLVFNYTQMTMDFGSSRIYGCTGTWTDNQFQCSIKWNPSGRECSGDFTVQAADDGSLTIWPFTNSGTVVCQKQ